MFCLPIHFSGVLSITFSPVFCFYSRVFYKRHKQIRNVIKIIVVQLLLNTEHLESYISRRIKQFSSHVNVVDNITDALNSPEADRIIDSRLDVLYSQPESYYIEALGLKREQLKPLIKPSIISLCAESAPFVLDTVTEQTDEVRRENIHTHTHTHTHKCMYVLVSTSNRESSVETTFTTQCTECSTMWCTKLLY